MASVLTSSRPSNRTVRWIRRPGPGRGAAAIGIFCVTVLGRPTECEAKLLDADDESGSELWEVTPRIGSGDVLETSFQVNIGRCGFGDSFSASVVQPEQFHGCAWRQSLADGLLAALAALIRVAA